MTDKASPMFVAFPPGISSDDLDARPSETEKSKSAKQRFRGLPIHKICHNQLNGGDSEATLKDLKRTLIPGKAWRCLRRPSARTIASGRQRDCLGMVPLHILACSGTRDLDLYRWLIDRYPDNLVTNDDLGCPPLLYAFWSGASPEVVRLFVERHRTLFPGHAIDWVRMVETVGRTLCAPGRTRAALACVKAVLATQKTDLPDHRIDWQRAAMKWAAHDAVGASDPEVRKFHRLVFEEVVAFSVADRVNSLSVRQWREEILRDVARLPWFVHYRRRSAAAVYSKLSRCELMDRLKEAACLLELASWKARIDEMSRGRSQEIESCAEKAKKQSCRVRSGAEIVVPSVLAFLVPSEGELSDVGGRRCYVGNSQKE